jgi:hypothetical protein
MKLFILWTCILFIVASTCYFFNAQNQSQFNENLKNVNEHYLNRHMVPPSKLALSPDEKSSYSYSD